VIAVEIVTALVDGDAVVDLVDLGDPVRHAWKATAATGGSAVGPESVCTSGARAA
jgi:hypothetical protein